MEEDDGFRTVVRVFILKQCPSIPILLSVFVRNKLLNFIEVFLVFFFFGDNHDFLLRSNNMLDYVNGFLNVEPSLHAWNMSHDVFFFLCSRSFFLMLH